MAVCGERTYDMIELASLFDLRDSRIVEAQIVSIDSANNTAEVTLISTCAPVSELTLTDVEFFYHCEYSTGTIEDLADGYKAFSVGDDVILIYSPAKGDVTERLYIVGHADIKNVSKCASNIIAIGGEPTGAGESFYYNLWETILSDCTAPISLFMDHRPMHLLNVRYTYNDVIASLITSQDKESADYQVIVDRKGGTPYRHTTTYSASLENVSAAISNDLSTLYVVETWYISATYRRGTYFKFTFDVQSGVWSQAATGYVPWVAGYNATSNYFVDRDGVVSGQLEQNWEDDNTYTSEGGYCSNSSSGNIEQETAWICSDDNSYTYSIETGTTSVTTTGIKPVGASIQNGDIEFLTRQLINNRYVWTYELYSHDHTDGSSGWDHYEFLTNSFIPFSVLFGPTDLGIDQNGGLYETHTGHTTDSYTAIPPTGYEYTYNFSMTYDYFAGSRQTDVTVGGWITRSRVGTSAYLNTDMSGGGFQSGDDGNYFVRQCFDWDSVRSSNRVTVAVDSKTIIYPENLGEYHTVTDSFYSYDQQSNTSYYGICYAETSTDTPTWRVFKNGVSISNSLPSCLGHPLDELGAIYFRA